MVVVELKDFEGLDLRVGEIVEAMEIKGSDNIKLKVDIGEINQTVAELKKWYSPRDLIGKKIIFLSNLKSKKIHGIEVQGIILCAKEGDKVSILTVDKDVEIGTRIR